MLLVIFGAGASYDSLARLPPMPPGIMDPLRDFRPPLANQLFEPRWGPQIQQFRQASSLIPDLEAPNTDVESQLENFQNRSLQYSRLKVQLVAIRYYLQRMISDSQTQWDSQTNGVTNYNPLLLQIDSYQNDQKLIVSFNYDTLLEQALTATLGIQLGSLGDYVKSDYKLIKPHGSVNWWHRVEAPQFRPRTSYPDDRAPDVIDRAQELQITPAFEIGESMDSVAPGNPVIPGMSIPLATKSEYECPPDHLQVLSNLLPSIDKILIIGWRATEKRFLKSLIESVKENVSSILIVSRNRESAEIVRTELARRGLRLAAINSTHGGFSEAIRNHEFDGFLKKA